jgi:hypothetical protein
VQVSVRVAISGAFVLSLPYQSTYSNPLDRFPEVIPIPRAAKRRFVGQINFSCNSLIFVHCFRLSSESNGQSCSPPAGSQSINPKADGRNNLNNDGECPTSRYAAIAWHHGTRRLSGSALLRITPLLRVEETGLITPDQAGR